LVWAAIADEDAMAMVARTKSRSSDLVLPLLCMPIKYHAIAAGERCEGRFLLGVPIDWKQAQPNRLAGVPAIGRRCQF